MSKANTRKTPADHVIEGAGFATITLSRSAKINGIEVASMRMREPTVGDIEAGQESKEPEAAREITTFANLCECAPDDIRALPLRDYGRLQAAFALFTS